MSELHIKLGKLLQLERERCQLGIEELSEELKIPIESLRAIEAGNISAMPSELYFALFAKSYAERLGIDYTGTVEAIKADLEQTSMPDAPAGTIPAGAAGNSDQQESTGKNKDAAQPLFGKRVLMLISGIVFGFAALLGIYALFFNGSSNSEVQRLDHAANENSGTIKAALTDYTAYSWNIPAETAREELKLTLVAQEESWATVIADGDTVIYRSLKPWREYTASARYRLLVSIGRPSKVETRLNGSKVSLIDPAKRRISRVEINQLNAARFVAGTFFSEVSVSRQRQGKSTPPVIPEATKNSGSPGDSVNISDDHSNDIM